MDLLQRGMTSGSILTVDPEDAKQLGKPWTRRYIYNQSQCGRCKGPVKVWDMAGRTVSEEAREALLAGPAWGAGRAFFLASCRWAAAVATTCLPPWLIHLLCASPLLLQVYCCETCQPFRLPAAAAGAGGGAGSSKASKSQRGRGKSASASAAAAAAGGGTSEGAAAAAAAAATMASAAAAGLLSPSRLNSMAAARVAQVSCCSAAPQGLCLPLELPCMALPLTSPPPPIHPGVCEPLRAR